VEGVSVAMAYGAQTPAPVLVAFAGQAAQRRATVFFRLVLALPQIVVVVFVSIGACVVVVIGWFGALFTGRLPAFAAVFLSGYVRWTARVSAYMFLLTDRYPPFSLEEAEYPVHVTVQPGPLNRAAVFFRLVLVIPAYLLTVFVQYGIVIVLFFTWLIVAAAGRMPSSLYLALAAGLRYSTRMNGYLFLVTSQYPWGLFGDTDTDSKVAPVPPTADAAPVPAPVYGAPVYGAPATGAPAYEAPDAPPAPDVPVAPVTPAAPVPPAAPFAWGVRFAFGGPTYLWGYTDDHTSCGIWSAADVGAPPQLWPIGEQAEAWARFRTLEPHAVAFSDPVPPPTSSPWAGGGTTPAGAAAYGMPAYGVRSAALPSYAVPSPAYGGSAYGAPWTPVDDPRWRLVLSRAAKRLLVIILIVGAVAYCSVLYLHPPNFENVLTSVRVQVDDEELTVAVDDYRSQTSACHTLSCSTAADLTLAQAYGTFVRNLEAVSVPAAAAPAAATLAAEGTHAQQVFARLAASTSAAQYQRSLASAHVQQLFDRFDQDYQRLRNQLNGFA
jgi:hypothetical protein